MMIKRLPAEEETKVIEQLQQLAKQDDDLTLPHSLRSSSLLGKLQEQPSLVSMEGGLLTRKRTMYVVSTCAAAFLMVIGLVKFYPLMSKADSMGAAPAVASSSYAAAAQAPTETAIVSNYQQIADALRILNDAAAADQDGMKTKTGGTRPNVMTAAAPSVQNELKATDGDVDTDEIPDEGDVAPEAFEEEVVAEETAVEEEDVAMEEAIVEEEAVEEEILLTSEAPILYSMPADNNLVSTSGEWVFWLEQDDSTTLHLINSETLEEEASLSLPEASMVSELAAYSNMLVCIDPNHFTAEEDVQGITVYLYQLGEDKTASLLNTIAVSGTFDQSYLTSDGILFLASNQNLDMEAVANNTSDDLSEILPKVFNDQYQDKAEPLPVENIAVIDTPVQPNYLNITAIDLANGGAACTWSFLGREGTITISDHIMQMITPDGEGGSQLISIDFSGNTVQYRISKSIPEE